MKVLLHCSGINIDVVTVNKVDVIQKQLAALMVVVFVQDYL